MSLEVEDIRQQTETHSSEQKRVRSIHIIELLNLSTKLLFYDKKFIY